MLSIGAKEHEQASLEKVILEAQQPMSPGTAITESFAKLLSKQRPQSHHNNTGSVRMSRLQRLYSTQRGRNILNLVSGRAGVS